MNRKVSRASLSLFIIIIMCLFIMHTNQFVLASEAITPTADIVGNWTAKATLVENTMGDIEHERMVRYETEERLTGLRVETYLERYQPSESILVTLHIYGDGKGYADFEGVNQSNEIFHDIGRYLNYYEDRTIVAYASGWYNDQDIVMASAIEFSGIVKKEKDKIVIEGQLVHTLDGVEGRAVYTWTGIKDALIVGEKPVGDEDSVDEADIPILTGYAEDPKSKENSKEHVAPMVTALISIIAGIGAIIGGAGGIEAGSLVNVVTGPEEIESSNEDEVRIPVYERDRVPEFPEFVVGEHGEQVTKKLKGTIEASFPNGNIATYFPNGTVQMKYRDGITWEQWSDGVVSTTNDGQFIVKDLDGTVTVHESNGEELILYPDGKSIETKANGTRVKKNKKDEVQFIEWDCLKMARNQKDHNTWIVTSTYGGSLIIREESRMEYFRKDNKWESTTVTDTVTEGEVKLENGTYTYKADGSLDVRSEDGTIYKKQANGSMTFISPDGTDLRHNSETGETEYKLADGSYLKSNENTGEIDGKLEDGSYWKRDVKVMVAFIMREMVLRAYVVMMDLLN